MQGPFPVCCIYCHRQFFISRWDLRGFHTCKEAQAHRRKAYYHRELTKRRKQARESYHRCKEDRVKLTRKYDYEYQPDPMHLCPRCKKNMTRNKMNCITCLNQLEKHTDIETDMIFEAGIAIRRRGAGTVCRMGGRI